MTRKNIVAAASQVVLDMLVPDCGEKLRQNTAELRARLHELKLIPGEKVNAKMQVVEVQEDGTIIAELSGGCLAWKGSTILTMKQPFPVGLRGYQGPEDVTSVVRAIPMVKVHKGGNIQNMTLNILALIDALKRRFPAQYGQESLRVISASSSDPFGELDNETAGRFREMCDVYKLDLDDRYAIQFPWEAGEKRGHLSITSEPHIVLDALQKLIAENPEFAGSLCQSVCVISADAIGPVIDQVTGKPAYVINPSSAMRTKVAVETAKRPAILPMNKDEAKDVLHIMLAAAMNEELHNVKPPLFPSPIEASGLKIDHESLTVLDSSLGLFRRYDPPYAKLVGMGFSSVITFGEEGGLVHGVGTGQNSFYCFTSTPNKAGTEKIISYLDRARLFAEEHDVGCGDSVAAAITLFNAVDPIPLLTGFMLGDEAQHPIFRELAATVFVSAVSRVMGYLILRTTNTYIDNIQPEKLLELLLAVAKSCVELTRQIVKKTNEPSFGILPLFGIRCVTWIPGTLLTFDQR
jgi:hypothetical protein